MAKLLSEAKISYIKWDMNRSITECYSAALPADQQGEVYHRYILGVYDCMTGLQNDFPMSCSSPVQAAADVLIRDYSTTRRKAGRVMIPTR